MFSSDNTFWPFESKLDTWAKEERLCLVAGILLERCRNELTLLFDYQVHYQSTAAL